MPERIPCRCLLHDAYPDMEALIQSVIASMPEEERQKKLRGWHKAVERAKDWARDED